MTKPCGPPLAGFNRFPEFGMAKKGETAKLLETPRSLTKPTSSPSEEQKKTRILNSLNIGERQKVELKDTKTE